MWYKVQDNLPKFDELVLVWCEGFGYQLARYSIDNKWYNQNYSSAVVSVTHWQHLPQQPHKGNTYA